MPTHQRVREADEPGVAILRAGPGLARDKAAQRRLAPGAAIEGGLEHRGYRPHHAAFRPSWAGKGGGGRADFAQGGGPDGSRADAALAAIERGLARIQAAAE
jgi:hypothetical protein